MKTKNLRCKRTSISTARWASYAAAGAATALAGSNTAEADIHYSGLLHARFPPNSSMKFPLDQPGESFLFSRNLGGIGWGAYFRIYGIDAASFRGTFTGGDYYYASKLHFGQQVSQGPFIRRVGYEDAILVRGSHDGYLDDWLDRSKGYVGFRFNNGAGVQYGWVRVGVSGIPRNAFAVVDYAYADPGEPLRAGQMSSDNGAIRENSLGALALGALGLLAWRRSRSQQDDR